VEFHQLESTKKDPLVMRMPPPIPYLFKLFGGQSLIEKIVNKSRYIIQPARLGVALMNCSHQSAHQTRFNRVTPVLLFGFVHRTFS
tara:strand:- start:179 stop:436 length:258 start_codon:yes stop_codon:yes gene_type:complete